jgi:hypothetical protein
VPGAIFPHASIAAARTAAIALWAHRCMEGHKQGTSKVRRFARMSSMQDGRSIAQQKSTAARCFFSMAGK